MRLVNLKRVSDYKVEKWLYENIVELTAYQKQRIKEDEIVRFAPFKFYERRSKVDSFLIRLTIVFIPVAWCILVISLPFHFIATGSWGYKNLSWFSKWLRNCGL